MFTNKVNQIRDWQSLNAFSLAYIISFLNILPLNA